MAFWKLVFDHPMFVCIFVVLFFMGLENVIRAAHGSNGWEDDEDDEE